MLLLFVGFAVLNFTFATAFPEKHGKADRHRLHGKLDLITDNRRHYSGYCGAQEIGEYTNKLI